MQFSTDERLVCRVGVETVQVFAADRIGEGPLMTGSVPRIAKAALSPGPLPFSIATFVPEGKVCC